MKQIGSVEHVVKEQQTPEAPEPRLRYKVRRVKRKRSKVNNWQLRMLNHRYYRLRNQDWKHNFLRGTS